MKESATEKWIAQIRDLMLALDGLEISERHRRTLRRVCASALVEAEDRHQFDDEHRNSGKPFTKEEMVDFVNTLNEASPAMTYGEEQIVLIMLAQRFGRDAKVVKKKAIELGHGNKVDYWLNKDRE
jgi:hypothetical protein